MNSIEATMHKRKFGNVALSARKLIDQVGAEISLSARTLTIRANRRLGIKMLGYVDHVCKAYKLELVRK